MVNLTLIPVEEFQRVQQEDIDKYLKIQLLADMCRANTLASVKKAGSGHLGSSFSAMDIVAALYYWEMNVKDLGIDSADRDIYFSSKGHDVPGLYSVLYAVGILPEDQLLKLRRLGGLDGHPNVRTPGIEANTGSLGMGISKGKGMAVAKRINGNDGEIFVLTGDGEFQEGQIYESLQTTSFQKVSNITVIVDHNKVQSDMRVKDIIDLGDLESKLNTFGWHVARCDGHDYKELESVFKQFRTITHKPKILIADTIKGKGISFMEHPADMKENGLYRWHSGAPNDESFSKGYEEITTGINKTLTRLGLAPLALKEVVQEKPKAGGGVSKEYVAEAYGEALLEIGGKRKDVVVLDADLAADCRIRKFQQAYPERFIENGIAEQDMVSMAGGLASLGMLPVCNTFASFLAARANEQIYNNGGENTRIIYACHYSGLIPAGPGLSHQSIRDISLFNALPNVTILQPCNAHESAMVVDYAINEAKENCVIRLIIGPSPRLVQLPSHYKLQLGRGVALTQGNDAVLFAYGPVMINEALKASEILETKGFRLKVVNMPWLNKFNPQWLKEIIGDINHIYTLDDHSTVGGFGDNMLSALNDANLFQGRQVEKFGLDDYPEWGTPPEVLHFHRLDGETLSQRILK